MEGGGDDVGNDSETDVDQYDGDTDVPLIFGENK